MCRVADLELAPDLAARAIPEPVRDRQRHSQNPNSSNAQFTMQPTVSPRLSIDTFGTNTNTIRSVRRWRTTDDAFAIAWQMGSNYGRIIFGSGQYAYAKSSALKAALTPGARQLAGETLAPTGPGTRTTRLNWLETRLLDWTVDAAWQTFQAVYEATFPRGAKPGPQQYGVSPEGAEHLVAQWLRWLGALDASVTRFSQDGGVDVSSDGWRISAQVKNYKKSVPIESIRALHGVASMNGTRPYFFTSGSYPRSGFEFASETQMPLFVYDAESGTLTPCNAYAQTVMTLPLVRI